MFNGITQLRERAGPDRLRPLPAEAGPIAVASDGYDPSRAALEAALALSWRRRIPIRIVAVLPRVPNMPLDFGVALMPVDDFEARRDALLRRVRAQIVEVAGTNAEWPIEIRVGDPATEIVRSATESGARLIVLGVEHRSAADRLLARETAIHLLRIASVPILIAPSGFTRAPLHMVLASDFSHASLRGAVTALDLFPTITRVELAHVVATDRHEPIAPTNESIASGFQMTTERLTRWQRGLSVVPVLLHGKPAAEVLELARAVKADLLVSGSLKRDLVDRVFSVSVSRSIVRGSPCAVLVIPTLALERDRLGPRHAVP